MTAGKALKVSVVRLPHANDLPLPAYQSDEAAGLDIVAAVAADAPMTIHPGERALVPTGLVLELPRGSEAQVRPRSGLAFKHGLTVLNSPGTIDSDYRGEVKVLLINLAGQVALEQRARLRRRRKPQLFPLPNNVPSPVVQNARRIRLIARVQDGHRAER
mgnify:CR=1 FL=1